MDAEPEASVSEVVGKDPNASNISIVIRSEYNEVIYYYYISRSLHDQLTTELYRQVGAAIYHKAGSDTACATPRTGARSRCQPQSWRPSCRGSSQSHRERAGDTPPGEKGLGVLDRVMIVINNLESYLNRIDSDNDKMLLAREMASSGP